ncbi:hypothetical protein [Natrinema longum]|uniref:Uncharacterized protein n=1 Tax=Natrinema longum TaxID=370324 RepID=A0A8A2UCU8_9EURY|nr:hypothetical protein [Natrinema longum]MBZ6495633.1 hypothetical protein [Natrinema longum]QSW86404.1 hypothetical protein J0X27_06190 [Natrinema longum]
MSDIAKVVAPIIGFVSTVIIVLTGFAILSPFAERCPTETFPDACNSLIFGSGTALSSFIGPLSIIAFIIAVLAFVAANSR